MTDLATPKARRLQRPSWRDARLIIGLILVLTATAGGALLMSRLDVRTPVYMATRALVPGAALAAGDVVRVDVRLDDGVADYLSAADAPAPGTHVLREVRSGELVPSSAVGPKSAVTTQPLALTVDEGAASTLQVGQLVDVYVNRPADKATGTGADAYQGPERVLEGIPVLALPTQGTGFGGAGGGQRRAVQVMVPAARVEALIAAVDIGSRITLVPVPGSVAAATS